MFPVKRYATTVMFPMVGLLLSVSFGTCGALVAEEVANVDAALNEIIEGYQRNQALIPHGTAVYEVDIEHPLWKRERQTKLIQTVIFDTDRVRVETEEGNHLTSIETVTPRWYAKYFGRSLRGGLSALHAGDIQSIIVQPPERAPQFAVHPAMCGTIDVDMNLAELLQAFRRSKTSELTIERQENLYVITVENPIAHHLSLLKVAIDQGYGVVRHEMRSTLQESDPPYLERTSEFQSLPRGGYVVKSTHKVFRARNAEKVLETSEVADVVLKEIDVQTQPTPILFEFEGMGLPRGLDFQDRIHRVTLRWGEDPIIEFDDPAEK